MRKGIDMTGKRCGRLLVIKQADTLPYANEFCWLCKCDCGNFRVLTGNQLRKGYVISCGCFRDEFRAERYRKMHTKHNGYYTRLYGIWRGMKRRCNNSKMVHYDCYGGRGITYCQEWEKFEAFRDWALKNGYDDSLTLDRINVDGNYEPNNCKWSTRKEQANNKRNNTLITYNGETHNIKQWSEITGIASRNISYRYHAGWTAEEIFTIPIGGKRNEIGD